MRGASSVNARDSQGSDLSRLSESGTHLSDPSSDEPHEGDLGRRWDKGESERGEEVVARSRACSQSPLLLVATRRKSTCNRRV